MHSQSIEKKGSKGSISTQPQLVQKDDRDTISSFSRTGSSSSSSSGASLKNVTSSLGKVLKEEIANKTELDSTPSKEEKVRKKNHIFFSNINLYGKEIEVSSLSQNLSRFGRLSNKPY